MTILNGKEVAQYLKDSVKLSLAKYYAEGAPKCRLAIVMVGNDPASAVYIKNKTKACESVGIEEQTILLPEDTTQEQVEMTVKQLVNDDSIHGILVQLPLPQHLDSEKILELIPPHKDVDGFTSQNLGKLVLNDTKLLPCTPCGILYLLGISTDSLKGKHAVILGRSRIVGKPLALALLNRDCTVTICHSKTQNLQEICKSADILIAAIGKPKFVTANMVKDGAIVIDVGINRTETGLVGDVDFDNVVEECSCITPVPGGVGPMTVACLMENTFKAYENAIKK